MIFQHLSLAFQLLALTLGVSSALDIRANTPSFNSSLFKDLSVTRGLEYHYYAVPADTGKPTLVFLHGFPSTSYDWRHQVSFFQDKGFGLIVPDMLGYGGTAKPLDPHVYASSLISRDIVDIMDTEGIDQAVLISHDWGSKIASRLANYFPERFHSFAFLTVGYMAPSSFAIPYDETNIMTKAVLGYENFGYWDFFASEGADQIILEHLDSFFDIEYPSDTIKFLTDWAPLGALKAFLSNDTRIPPVDYVTPEERAIQMEAVRQGGFAAPLNWYKVVRGPIEAQDNEGIPEENTIIQKPVFFGAALRDYVCIAPIYIQAVIAVSNSTLTIHEYDTGHWLMMEGKDEVNRDLLQWIEGLGNL